MLDRGSARLCCLAKDCDNPEYTQLVRALCDEGSVHLIMVSREGVCNVKEMVSCRYSVNLCRAFVSCPYYNNSSALHFGAFWFGKVDSRQELGQWAGLCKIGLEGEATKIVPCSCAVVSACDVIVVDGSSHGGSCLTVKLLIVLE